MNCPACGQALLSGQIRCPGCAALVAGPAEGALAPSPQLVTPPARAAGAAAEGASEPVRQIPGLRKRERTWKDEVRDRVRHRREQRTGPDELPLFRDTEEDLVDAAAAEPAALAPPADPNEDAEAEAYPSGPRELGDEPVTEADFLRSFDTPAPPERVRAAVPPPIDLREERLQLEDEEEDEVRHEHEEKAAGDDRETEWRFDAPPASPTDTRPVERPAAAGDRAQAALVDFTLMLGVWAVVIYFASRAARVDLFGLRPSWPFLLGYLAFLGLAYAACFTGVTGQTLGKMLKGLRVVNARGRPPGFPRAFLRAALGSLGIVLAFGGIVPMFFDPARRGLHDRLLKTRVVKG